ncbi:MAG: thiamine pyrophosphate-dependent enzyme [Deltaproteobacteria bacterium]|nr:thiamine pyrophosphate-dependent enzyme [Deltaproteobacteria bacterium]
MTDSEKNRQKDLFSNDVEIQWCPGCPNHGILQAFKTAFKKLGKSPQDICLVSGIGQAAKLPHYLQCNFFNGLHGRALPVATGIQAANPNLTTVVATGDGDCYGEGGNHFIHALRRNPNITVVVHNNEIYALTKGQASPTTMKGEKRSLQEKGVQVEPLNALAVAILHNCTFVARGFAADTDHLSGLLADAMNHEGMAYVDVIQPCITWGEHPVKWYSERVALLPEDHDVADRNAALSMVLDKEARFRIGVIYRTSPREVFGAAFQKEVTEEPLAKMPFPTAEETEKIFEGFQPAA